MSENLTRAVAPLLEKLYDTCKTLHETELVQNSNFRPRGNYLTDPPAHSQNEDGTRIITAGLPAIENGIHPQGTELNALWCTHATGKGASADTETAAECTTCHKKAKSRTETVQHILLRKGRGGTKFTIACIGIKKPQMNTQEISKSHYLCRMGKEQMKTGVKARPLINAFFVLSNVKALPFSKVAATWKNI